MILSTRTSCSIDVISPKTMREDVSVSVSKAGDGIRIARVQVARLPTIKSRISILRDFIVVRGF